MKGQSVGVVLSGGGASGMAHIGVLHALEENDIPIDFIAGTSMGAVIGGLYASGMTLEEMEFYFTSDDFIDDVNGNLSERYNFYFQKEIENASMVSLKVDPDTILLRTIPSYIISPVQLDMRIMESVSGAIASAGYDFDSLFVPFRCVAADIVAKELILFKSGELHTALRASSTFPFFFKPLEIDGRLLFDGGLYNNYPLDIMYNEFHPDVIIGSSVSIDTPPPYEDDLFSQVENMIVNRGDERMPCEEGISLHPETGIETLEFDKSGIAIRRGYELAIQNMDSIKGLVSRRVKVEDRQNAREAFINRIRPYELGEIMLKGTTPATRRYFKKVLRVGTKDQPYNLEQMMPLYYRLFEDAKIKYIYPQMKFNEESGKYDLQIDMEEEKKLLIDFGGNFSSRPVNTGFVGLRYNILGSTPKTIYANSYFGKFYNSLFLETRFDVPGRNPYFFSANGILQQWDYFRSFATFFQESRPSFILQRESAVGVKVGRPAGNQGLITLDATYGLNEHDYYQTDEFTNTDTTDVTDVEYFTTGLSYERKTLNRKLYPNKGTHLRVKARYVDGREHTIPGSTGILINEFRSDRNWFTFGLTYENYFKTMGKLDLGVEFDGIYSTQDFFSNHQATLLTAPYYQPIPESKTIFQGEFRAHRFGALGLKLVYGLTRSVDLRFENYIFQPVNEIIQNDDFTSRYSDDFLKRFYIGSGSLVFHSPLGPLSLSLNYYDQRDEPWSWIINFGYLIFNKRPLD